ncbi:aspartyl protease family protein [Neolewinella lacunae]|uniref:Peptidase A2 domain-containing protein n=1 Tax=Neolewinella lacunae TaxID=1517758 RepID=A0A923PJ70_9BACT|nr:aspartyl protease family protein [Neolewinella lacunae]MBC6993666.1 hypothetical protein [Neolewinella lacunae]MDN3636361.1 aspartyl protease family protein [Neolewinella lacunae]
MLRPVSSLLTLGFRWLLAVGMLLVCSSGALPQDAVSVLKAGKVGANAGGATAATLSLEFELERNLIFFPAVLDGDPGTFILDTGAPRLLLNNHGAAAAPSFPTGMAAGGEVALTNRRVNSFQMGGRESGKQWALALDLRAMEQRLSTPIDGYVGYELFKGSELRIDYPARTFQLRKSERRPQHDGRAPQAIFHFEYVDHLPVITVKSGKTKLRFAIDTGAGANLIDASQEKIFRRKGSRMNIQGLDGASSNYDIVNLEVPLLPGVPTDATDFVSMDLTHLQSPEHSPIDGILGSAFLADYCVGIDYRRRKLYLW